jgi:hypothetical protein
MPLLHQPAKGHHLVGHRRSPGFGGALETRPYPATADDHPARDTACYSPVQGAQAGSLAPIELDHHQGHELGSIDDYAMIHPPCDDRALAFR